MTATERISPEVTDWLDGPRLVAWLRENGLESVKRQLDDPTLERAWRRWREGGKASVYVLDQILVKLHLHLSDIPDGLWITSPIQGSVATTRESVVRLFLLGLSPTVIARRLGIDRKTVYEHRRRAGLA